MDQRYHKQGSSSGGFILGVIVGVVLTLLLTTKKGRKMLHTLTEEGLEKVSGWEELLTADEGEMEEGSDYVKDVTAAPMSEEQPKMRLKTHKPRLFRGVPKRNSVYKN